MKATKGIRKPARLSDEQIEQMRKLCFGRHQNHALDKFNELYGMDMSMDQFRRIIKENNITAHIYPPEVNEFIMEHYKGTGYQQMADMLNEHFGTEYTKNHVKQRYQTLKLDSGLNGRFEKGHVPWSAGKKWDEYMPKASQENSRKTCYKKGNMPVDHKPVGTISIRSQHGNKDPRDNRNVYYIKTKEPRTWQPLHRYNWEQAYGEIPKGSVVVFVNGDSLDPRVENLAILPRSLWSVMNHIGVKYTCREEFDAAVLLAKTSRKVYEIKQQKKKAKNRGVH